MNVIFVTARYDGDGFDNFLAPSLSHIKAKCVNVSDKEGSSNRKTISQKYNAGIQIVKDQNMLNDSMIVFCKSSVNILDPIAIDKMRYIFTEKPNVGVIGVAGVRQINGNKEFYDMSNKPVNGLVYGDTSGDGKGNHIQFSKNGFYDDVIGVDDSMFVIRGDILTGESIKFENVSDSGYGLDISLSILESGYDAVVADILVLSRDQTNYGFELVNNIVSKYRNSYPLNSGMFTNNRTSVVDIEI